MKQSYKSFQPSCDICQIDLTGTTKLSSSEITYENVGHKAYGLASIPQTWCLPFVAVSYKFYDAYKSNFDDRREILVQWHSLFSAALSTNGFQRDDIIIVRSSGCSEELDKRGKFYSFIGTVDTLSTALEKCLIRIYRDKEVRAEQMPLIIQKYSDPLITKGHLSNERRCYEEHRDWLGEFDSDTTAKPPSFQINLRKWRNNSLVDLRAKLSCDSYQQIIETLNTPAKWATQRNVRIHFEWVWNGREIYIVQADEEQQVKGHNPVYNHKRCAYSNVQFAPLCLREVNEADATKFKKIANTETYSKLGLQTAPLYILDNKEILRQLYYSHIDCNLRSDLKFLVKGSLIIRSDLATDELIARQFLPRTDEIRKLTKAIRWLTETSKILHESQHDYAFIFHNFIPSEAAAFAYATPTDPIVQIESLWGLPEGLYYNSHDKYRVDTDSSDINTISEQQVAKFAVKEKRGFKRVFVSPSEDGTWRTVPLSPPFDWKGSLSLDACRYIAFHSRRVATEEKRAVSIMWFVGVPASIAQEPAIPWYHEEFGITSGHPSLASKTKSLFDNHFVIRSAKDIQQLNRSNPTNKYLTRIRLQPTDEKLLRDKGTLKKIGEISKSKGAILVLEGAVLSHAYYQLLSTGANVEVVNPFIGFDEKHVYNKLVRDQIPDIIERRGEQVKVTHLNKKSLILALREKLVEEAYELLDANGLESIKSEIVDIREVIEAIASRFGIKEEELWHAQQQKRLSRGGFDNGVVLLETQSLLPTHKDSDNKQLFLSGIQNDTQINKSANMQDVKRPEITSKWSDRRVSENKTVSKIRLVTPIAKDSWHVKTQEEHLRGANGSISIMGSVKGKRSTTQWSIDLTVTITKGQEELL